MKPNGSKLAWILSVAAFLGMTPGLVSAQSTTKGWQEKLSKPTYSQIRFNMYTVKMKDGVAISAAVWRPDVPNEKFPVIMLSTPYNKLAAGNIRDGEYFAHRTLYV